MSLLGCRPVPLDGAPKSPSIFRALALIALTLLAVHQVVQIADDVFGRAKLSLVGYWIGGYSEQIDDPDAAAPIALPDEAPAAGIDDPLYKPDIEREASLEVDEDLGSGHDINKDLIDTAERLRASELADEDADDNATSISDERQNLNDPIAGLHEVLDIIENAVSNVVTDSAATDSIEESTFVDPQEDDSRDALDDSGSLDKDAESAAAATPAAIGKQPSPLPLPKRTVSDARVLWRTSYANPPWLQHQCSKSNRYFHLLIAREGMSSWVHTLHEAISAAKALGRIFVEPCVRAGYIVPCWPDRVASLPVSAADAVKSFNISHDIDPLAVPAFAEACSAKGFKVDDNGPVPLWRQPSQGRAYPLRLYLDLAPLVRSYSKFVSFEDWLRCARKKRKKRPGVDTVVSKADGRITADKVYCVTDRAGQGKARERSAGCRKVIGPFTFDHLWTPATERAVSVPPGPEREPHAGHMMRNYREILRSDVSRNMYVAEAWRGSFYPAGTFTRLPTFNDVHRHAVRAWLRHGPQTLSAGKYRHKPKASASRGRNAVAELKFSGRSYASFHWATAGVPEWKLAGCAKSLARRTAVLAGWEGWGIRPLKAGADRSGKSAFHWEDANRKRSLKVGVPFTPSPSRTPSPHPLPPFHPSSVLISDVSGPSNPCSANYVPQQSATEGAAAAAARSVSPTRRKALRLFLRSSGLRKYDEDHPAVDAGVLSIRDYLLARDAAHYVTCHGGAKPAPGQQLASGRWTDAECRACARTDSPYVEALIAVRKSKGKGAITSWFTGDADSAK